MMPITLFLKHYEMTKTFPFPKMIALLIAMCALSASSNAQNKVSKHLEEAKKAIAKANLIYFDLYSKNDGSALTLYTQDACLMPPNAAAICGIEALAKDFKDTYAAGTVKSGKFTTKEVYGDALEFVTEEGLWNVFDANGKSIDEGKYLKLWKKTKEGWKIFRDSFNSNRHQEK
jgi:ketosteroid isomerase-like protein